MSKEIPFNPTTIHRLASQIATEESRSDSLGGEDYGANQELDDMLYSRHVEVKSLEDLMAQRGTSIPALYNMVYKFISNPSTVSVETFKRMVDTDDTVGSGVDFLTTCLAARMGRYTHPNDEISKFVNDRLEEIDNGWTNCMKEMLSATWAGFYVGEKVWANTSNGFTIKKIVPLPASTLLFETERTGELTPDGILQYQRNYNPAMLGSGTAYLFGFIGPTSGSIAGLPIRPDPYAKLGDLPFPLRMPNIYSYLSIRIPVEKCVHYAFDAQGKFGNHYGRSLLRRAYKFWILKDAVLQMMGTALDRKGTPLTVVYVDPAATFIDTDKYNGSDKLNNREIGIRAQLAVKGAFEKIHNDTVIILPGKKGEFVDTDFIQQTSNAGDFISALEFLNKSLMRALLVPSLIFTNGDGTGSFALGQEHAKTFDKLLDGILSGFKQVLVKQIVEPLIRYNFPESAWRKEGLGDFSGRELSIDEREKEMNCVATAIDKGAIDMNDLDDLNKVREIAGFKPRETPIPKPEVEDGMDGGPMGEQDAQDGDSGSDGEEGDQ